MKNIKECNRVIIKIGSSLIINEGKGINETFLNNISDDISSLCKEGIDFLVVSSGAIELVQLLEK